MQKQKWKLTAIIVVMAMLCGCAGQPPVSTDEKGNASQTDSTDLQVSEETIPEETKDTEVISLSAMGDRPMLINTAAVSGESSVTACVEQYEIEPDLSNVENMWQFYLDGEITDKIAQNGFVISGNAGSEFFQIYEENRYSMIPNFVTVDSMMHTYHLYFSHLLKNVEREYLTDSVTQLSKRMLADSIAQYEVLKGSEWESAAARNVAFFTVGAKLLDENTAVNEDVADVVQYELACIAQAGGIGESQITGDFEDYSQYTPRGYYEGDAALEAYFRAMMWYGRIHFTQETEELNRSALLITKALGEDAEAYRLWESVYAVTSFFAGASDDLGVCEYAPVIGRAYGDAVTTEDLIGDTEAFSEYCAMIRELPVPAINSLPIMDGDDNVIRGFRFMGQRFTIDAAIMQKLIYSDVKANSEGEKRMLPDVLDVPAALGSDMALRILEENGATDYEGYSENMDMLRSALSEADDSLFSASLYAGWLNTLRPLLEEKGEGYPAFMQSEEWCKKNLECFAGSFTELKHDTVLYSKQVMAEMGGGMEEEPDDRGYVEPEPLVYERFRNLSLMTAQGLKKYGMLSAADEENLARLSELADRLSVISVKELTEEPLTDEEYELIKSYGGNIEHFWYEAIKGEDESEYISAQAYPAAIVVDIATNPNGAVLEIATGNPSTIYVAVKVDGKIKLARGSVYTFYQFIQPIDNRLTDSEWRLMMGLQADENGNYHYDTKIAQPAWTDSYRFRYDWE